MSFDKTIKDAQEFIDTMNAFNKPKQEKETTLENDQPSFNAKFLNRKLEFSPAQRFQNNEKSAFRADVLTFIETYYYENQTIPPPVKIRFKFNAHPNSPNTVAEWNVFLDSIADSLQNRGISP